MIYQNPKLNKTPFKIAQENGFLGTEEEFNSDLVNITEIDDIAEAQSSLQEYINGITAASIGAATQAEVNELKTSVSEGKSLIAAAVTNKGVQTAANATFATIANNINSIISLKDGTADATAIAEDIRFGKIAYVNGEKIVGIMRDGTVNYIGSELVHSNTFYRVMGLVNIPAMYDTFS